MFLTGFADEAGKELSVQIAATKALQWRHIESRSIGTGSLASITDAEFDVFGGMLKDAGIKISCYGSSIANFRKHPRNASDLEESRRELRQVIPRMKELGVGLLRGMSFANPVDEEPDCPELEKVIFRHVNELVSICESAGIVYGHENCMNYGGLSYLHTLKLLDNIRSDHFKLIFDTGNPIARHHRRGEKPYRLQSAWEFYCNVREFIVYVHIKDGVPLLRNDAPPYLSYTFPGDGCGDVRPILMDLLARGYDGGISIEPHMAMIYRELCDPAPDELERFRFENYIRYGRKLEALLCDCDCIIEEGEVKKICNNERRFRNESNELFCASSGRFVV